MSSTPSESSSESSKPPASSSQSSWSSWFVSPSAFKEKFQEFDDQQRIDRLSECRKLDKILHDCRKRHQPGKPKSRFTKPKDDKDDPIESVSIGVRNMKYFGWRGILKSGSPSTQKGTTGGDGDTADADSTDNPATPDGPDLSVFHPKIRSSCAREEHAVWACRAVATGCGKDLSELKKCFEDVDGNSSTSEASSLPQHVRVLTSPYTNYQGILEKVGDKGSAAMKQQIPCHEIQRRLGSCVSENGRQLLERKQQREGTK